MNKHVNRVMLFCRRNAPMILTCVGGAGVVATSVMAVRATPKALQLLDEAEKKKGEELTKLESVRIAGPAYIPAILVGASTIACIFGANILNKRQQAAMASAYALLDNSYKEYKKKVVDLYGEQVDEKIKGEVAKDKYEPIEMSDDGELFYDYFSERYFESTLYDVQRAEYQLNRDIQMQGYSTLNDFYENLGIDPISGGDELGWSEGGNYARYWQDWIDFNHQKVVMDDGLECIIVTFSGDPYHDFDGFA